MYTGITAKVAVMNAANKALADGNISLHLRLIRIAARCTK